MAFNFQLAMSIINLIIIKKILVRTFFLATLSRASCPMCPGLFNFQVYTFILVSQLSDYFSSFRLAIDSSPIINLIIVGNSWTSFLSHASYPASCTVSSWPLFIPVRMNFQVSYIHSPSSLSKLSQAVWHFSKLLDSLSTQQSSTTLAKYEKHTFFQVSAEGNSILPPLSRIVRHECPVSSSAIVPPCSFNLLRSPSRCSFFLSFFSLSLSLFLSFLSTREESKGKRMAHRGMGKTVACPASEIANVVSNYYQKPRHHSG